MYARDLSVVASVLMNMVDPHSDIRLICPSHCNGFNWSGINRNISWAIHTNSARPILVGYVQSNRRERSPKGCQEETLGAR